MVLLPSGKTFISIGISGIPWRAQYTSGHGHSIVGRIVKVLHVARDTSMVVVPVIEEYQVPAVPFVPEEGEAQAPELSMTSDDIHQSTARPRVICVSGSWSGRSELKDRLWLHGRPGISTDSTFVPVILTSTLLR